MKVREIMTSGSLATATLDTTIEEIANMMKAEDVGAIPVLDDEEKLAGIITDRDIVVRAIAEGEDPTECTAEDILSEQLHTIEPEADLAEALALMSQHQIRRLPVVQEEQVIGIISLGDVSVKSQTEQAGEALEDISEGVRQQSEGGEREQEGREKQSQGQSFAVEAEQEEAEYPRGGKATSIRRGTAQMGSSRAESKQAGRGQNTGSQSRKRAGANQQNVTARGRQESSARGRDAGSVRGENAGRSTRGSKQGISNRSSRQENQRQQKVAPMRAESKTGRSQSKRRAS